MWKNGRTAEVGLTEPPLPRHSRSSCRAWTGTQTNCVGHCLRPVQVPPFTVKIGYATHSLKQDRVPDSISRDAMWFVTTPDATMLTGLSAATLREWTSRHALIPADVPPKGKGSSVGPTWQAILLFRIAVTLRDRFHLNLQPPLGLFANLKSGLRPTKRHAAPSSPRRRSA